MAGKLLDLELEMGDQRFRAGIHRLGASRSPSAEAERMMTVTILCRSVRNVSMTLKHLVS